MSGDDLEGPLGNPTDRSHQASDGYLPFRENIDYAASGGVTTVVEPGGSRRTPNVEQAARELGLRHITTGLRLVHH